jgi:hypothetical protein
MLELRRRSKSEKKFPPVALGNHVDTGGPELFTTEVEASMYPPQISFIVMPAAGLLAGIERTGALTGFRIGTYIIPRKMGGKDFSAVTARELHDHTAFSLSLAKSAYFYAVAELGIDGFDGSDIRDILMRRRDDTYNYVGGVSQPEALSHRHLHGLYLRKRGDLITVLVHVFASCKMSPYEIVVGRRQ